MFCATERGHCGDINVCFSNENPFATVNYLTATFSKNVYVSTSKFD